MMRSRKLFATISATALLCGGVGVPGALAATQQQDGLVNVAVGDVSILNNARIGVAASVAATICGVQVGPVVVLATQVDATSAQRTVCTTDAGPVTISQNR